MIRSTKSSDYKLIIRESDWRSTLRPVSNQRDAIAVGPLKLDLNRRPTGLLVQDLAIKDEAVGSDYAPMDTWCAIVMSPSNPAATPDEWVNRFRPSFAQRFILLLIGLGEDRSGWQCWMVHRGETTAITEFEVTGGDGLHAGGKDTADFFDDDPLRFSRVENAVGPGYDQLRRSSVALVGCSRSGTLAATMLTALGVRRLVMIDGDQIELHNLDGMFLAAESNVGEMKANVLMDRLHQFRSSMAITPVGRSLGARVEEVEIGNCDLIVTCVDQDGPRLKAATLAHRRMIPHLDIGTGVTASDSGGREIAADVRLLLPGKGCIACVGGLTDMDRARWELATPPGSLYPVRSRPWNETRLGSLITNNSAAVAMGIQSWIQYLNKELNTSIWHRLVWTQNGAISTDSAPARRQEDCVFCDKR